MKLKALVVTLLFAAGVAASVAVAKGPPPGKGKDKGKDAPAATSATVIQSCNNKVAFILKGEFKGSGGASASSSSPAAVTGSFQMDVKQANKHGRALKGKAATISVDAKTKFTRRGHAELADFEAGDSLVVHVRACKAKKEKKDKSGSDSTSTSTSTSTTPTTSTSTTTTGSSPAADQPVLLAKKVTGKPKKASSDDDEDESSTTTSTTTTAPTTTSP